VLLAGSILAVGILGLLALYPQSLESARRSGESLVLHQLANERMEALRSLAHDDADLNAGVHPATVFDSNGDRYYPVSGFPEQYSVRWTVQAGPTDGTGTAEPNMKTVTVEASYRVRYTAGGDPITENASQTVPLRIYLAAD
jgi:Tfp pilus assembly protein PilV